MDLSWRPPLQEPDPGTSHHGWLFLALNVKIFHICMILWDFILGYWFYFGTFTKYFFTLKVFVFKFAVFTSFKGRQRAKICIYFQLIHTSASNIWNTNICLFSVRLGTFWGSSQCTTTWPTIGWLTRTSTSRTRSQRSSSLPRFFTTKQFEEKTGWKLRGNWWQWGQGKDSFGFLASQLYNQSDPCLSHIARWTPSYHLRRRPYTRSNMSQISYSQILQFSICCHSGLNVAGFNPPTCLERLWQLCRIWRHRSLCLSLHAK